MTKIGDYLEEKISPLATKLANNQYLIAIRDGISLSMPLIIIGSIFMFIASFPVSAWEDWLHKKGMLAYLWKGIDSSFGLVGLVSAFGIAHSLSEQNKMDGLSVGIISLSSFILVTPFVSGEDGAGISVSLIGGQGLFVAIVLGIISTKIYQFFIDHDIQIKMPETVPSAVSKSFSAVLPGFSIIGLCLVVFGFLDKMSLPNLHDIGGIVLGKSLGFLGNNIISTMIVVAFNSLFWFLGIHGGHVLDSFMKPIWIANLDANRVAYQAKEALPYIITEAFMDNFVYIGGAGASLALVLIIAYYARKKNSSQRCKTLAPVAVIPGLFNINEPIMFGVPLVLNLVLLIPFMLAPMVNALIAYVVMSRKLVPLTRSLVTWTMPPIISGFLTTGSIAGSILQIVLIVVDVFIYLPFFAMLEKKFKEG